MSVYTACNMQLFAPASEAGTQISQAQRMHPPSTLKPVGLLWYFTYIRGTVGPRAFVLGLFERQGFTAMGCEVSLINVFQK